MYIYIFLNIQIWWKDLCKLYLIADNAMWAMLPVSTVMQIYFKLNLSTNLWPRNYGSAPWNYCVKPVISGSFEKGSLGIVPFLFFIFLSSLFWALWVCCQFVPESTGLRGTDIVSIIIILSIFLGFLNLCCVVAAEGWQEIGKRKKKNDMKQMARGRIQTLGHCGLSFCAWGAHSTN